MQLGRYQEAIADCSRSLRFVSSVKAFSRRGTAHSALENWEAAFSDFQRGVEIEPLNQECIRGMEECINGLAAASAAAHTASAVVSLGEWRLALRVAKAQLKWHCPKVTGNPAAPPLTGHQMVAISSVDAKRKWEEKCLVFGGRSVMQTLETVLQVPFVLL